MGFTLSPIGPQLPDGSYLVPQVDVQVGPPGSPIPGNALYYDPSVNFNSISSYGATPFFAVAAGAGGGVGGASGYGAAGGGLFGAEAGLGGAASADLGLPGMPGLPGFPGGGQFLNGPAGLPTWGNGPGYWLDWFLHGNPFGALQTGAQPYMAAPGDLFPSLGSFARFLGSNNIPFNTGTASFSSQPVLGNVPHNMAEPHPGQGPKPFITGSHLSLPLNPSYGFMPEQLGGLGPSLPSSAPQEGGRFVVVPLGSFTADQSFGPALPFEPPRQLPGEGPVISHDPNFGIQFNDIPPFGGFQ